MASDTSFDAWARDCPLKDGSQCVQTKRWCKRIRCPRLDIFKTWRLNEKEKLLNPKWWKGAGLKKTKDKYKEFGRDDHL